jgi:ribosomal protein L11 methyltransferase
LFSLLVSAPPDREDFLSAELWEAGTAGIVEENGRLRAFFDAALDSAALLHRFAEFAPEVRQEAPTDWAQVSQDSWPPLRIGRFFLIAPWRAEATPQGLLRLEVYPGMACGTGRHPATQLCLEAIGRHVKPGSSVLDIGAGSGILSSAAALLGARRVVGCDIDPEAVAIARERVATLLFTGSAEAIRSAWADVIVANIDAATIERIASEMERVRKPESTLILSGFPSSDIPQGFQAKETLRREDWVCLIC